MTTPHDWLGAQYDYIPPADLVSQSPTASAYQVGDGPLSTAAVPEYIVTGGRFQKGV
ncbi:Mycobacterium numidiamassiliense ORFan [Mycobacterium numidiamassiliense]|uniref:Mycobacterium numidiamassiliense ORFan n=1 Tax=Mycobacterium numidiamassiliense TaxID=1841861 RepID=A0A2U3PIM5_9MYCO|nr:hypothetical protein [Mycobacterium numidiamassiliense]SPM43601.1 Mycobacterium numidiamassiliense ORFan [Mycobacterium numidiamassiliense]